MEYLKVRERREKRHFDDALVVVTIEFWVLFSEICFVFFQTRASPFILLLASIFWSRLKATKFSKKGFHFCWAQKIVGPGIKAQVRHPSEECTCFCFRGKCIVN